MKINEKTDSAVKLLYLWLLFTFFISILISMVVLSGFCYEVNDSADQLVQDLGIDYSFSNTNSEGCPIISSQEWKNTISYYQNKLLLASILICLMIVSNRWGSELWRKTNDD